MPGGNEFNQIGDNGEITTDTKKGVCDCCGNTIEPLEKFLEVTYETEGSGDFPYGIRICKNCVRLAAKRLGVLR